MFFWEIWFPGGPQDPPHYSSETAMIGRHLSALSRGISPMKQLDCLRFGVTTVLAISLANAPAFAQRLLHHEGEESAKDGPWMNSKLSADERAEMVLKE